MTLLEQFFKRKSTSTFRTSGYLHKPNEINEKEENLKEKKPYLELKREKTSFRMFPWVNWDLILASATFFKVSIPNYVFQHTKESVLRGNEPCLQAGTWTWVSIFFPP